MPMSTETSSAAVIADDALWRAAIGKDTDYYLPRFAEYERGKRHFVSWHWPAFFFQAWWALYRRAWGCAYLFVGLYVLLVTPLWIATRLIVGNEQSARLAGTSGGLTWAVIAGMLANYLYYRRVKGLITTARTRYSDTAAQLAYVNKKGGTAGFLLVTGAGVGLTIIATLVTVVIVQTVPVPSLDDKWLLHTASAARAYQRGQIDETERLLVMALGEAEQLERNNSQLGATFLAQTLDKLGKVYFEQGQFDKAEPMYQRALAVFRTTAQSPDAPGLIRTGIHLAELYAAEGRFAAAEDIYRRNLNAREQVHGAEHPAVLGELNNLAEIYIAQKQYGTAESVYKRVLMIKEKALGPNHPSMIASLKKYAAVLRTMGRETEASIQEDRAEAISKNVQSEKVFTARSLDYPDHPLWPGLDATVTEIRRGERFSLFLLTQQRGIEGAGALGRFYSCCVASLAEQRRFDYVANSAGIDDYTENFVMTVFLNRRDEDVKHIVGEALYDADRFSKPGPASLLRPLCLYKP